MSSPLQSANLKPANHLVVRKTEAYPHYSRQEKSLLMPPGILAAHIGVILLITNNDGADSWRQRLLTARRAIREQISKRRKPYLIRVAVDGTLALV